MGNICINVKGHRTVTGACGPYNLEGSAIVVAGVCYSVASGTLAEIGATAT